MRYSSFCLLLWNAGPRRGHTRFLLFFTTLKGMYAHENEAYTPGIFLVVEAFLRRGINLPHASGIASVTAIPRLNQSWPHSLDLGAPASQDSEEKTKTSGTFSTPCIAVNLYTNENGPHTSGVFPVV